MIGHHKLIKSIGIASDRTDILSVCPYLSHHTSAIPAITEAPSPVVASTLAPAEINFSATAARPSLAAQCSAETPEAVEVCEIHGM